MTKTHGRRQSLGVLGLLLPSILFVCPCALALDPALDVSQYAHTAWRVRDGFVKGRIVAIAQTPDGYMWVGTEFGLYRFDGVRAVPWQPPAGQQLPSSNVHRLLVSRDGTLWIGTAKGLASWRDGRLTRYAEIADREIGALLEDRDGTIWVGEWNLPQGRLCAIRKGAVECYGTDGSLGWGALSLFEDSKGNLWVGGGGPPKFGFWHWKPGAPRFYSQADNGLAHSFAEDNEGGLLIGTPQGLMRFVDGKLEALPDALPGSMRGLTVYRLQRDREGSLWAGTVGGGLAHVHRGRTDVFTQSDGLSGNYAYAFLEDREGNLWVATTDGLDRFRSFAIPTWSARQGLTFTSGAAVLAGKDGTIWAVSLNSLTKLYEGEVTVYRQRPEGGASPANQPVHERIDRRLPQKFYSLFQDRNGHLWISSPGGLGYLAGEQFHPIPPFGTRVILSLGEEPSGDLWVQDQENGLFRLRDGKVTQHIPWDTIGRKDQGRSFAVDQVQGGLWISFRGGGVVYLKDGQVRTSYSASDGLGQGPVTDLRFGSRGTLWAATEGGLSRILDGRVTTLTSKDGLPCDTVHWSIQDNDHFSWLYMPCGLVRIARSDLDAWVSDPKHKVQPAVFDVSDGVRTPAQHGGFYPQASRAPDGRIWFAAFDGVGMIDPRHLPFNKIPPPVHIEQVIADRKSYYDSASAGTGDANKRLRLPALSRDLQIDYTALSLVVPERVLFKYKLEGFDNDWQDAGNRRQAFYTNLPPKNYTFRVKACNNSGVWNEAGTFLDFTVAPAYYQTLWFRLTLVAAFLAVLWGLYQLRLRQLAREFNAGVDARVGERTRIARELHDSLLQGFQGMMFRLQAVRDMLPETSEAGQALDVALERGDKAIAEGRDTVSDLRGPIVGNRDVAAALTALGEELASQSDNGRAPCVRVLVEGKQRELNPVLCDEIYRIAREALRNAFRHARAQKIEAEITYGDSEFLFYVRDDGIGLAPAVADQGARAGHWGLPGMRERAKSFGGKLEVWSEYGAGTEIELSVPAAIAYGKSDARRRFWFWRKKIGVSHGKQS